MENNGKKIESLMDGLGFKMTTKGTPAIRRAVEIVVENPDAMMTKEVYPVIAGARGEWGRVERNMRTAIAAAARSPGWDEAWRGMGGWGIPTNAELIRRIAREVRDAD